MKTVESLRKKYLGKTAAQYDKKREVKSVWKNEQMAVEHMLDGATGASVLDAPVGTGRFLNFYANQSMIVTGVDSSDDMLEVARSKIPQWYDEILLLKGDIFNPPLFPSARFDFGVCTRFIHHLHPEDMQRAIGVLAGYCDSLIVSVRGPDVAPTFRSWRLHSIDSVAEAAGKRVVRQIQLDNEGNTYWMVQLK